MKHFRKGALTAALVIVSLTLVLSGQNRDENSVRAWAGRLSRDGNYKEAYEIFAKLTLSADTSAKKVPQDLTDSIRCLSNLNRVNEIDALLEKAITVHKDNWRFLQRWPQRSLSWSTRRGGRRATTTWA